MSHLHSQLTIDLFMYIVSYLMLLNCSGNIYVFKSAHIHIIYIKILYSNTSGYSFLVAMNYVNYSRYLINYKSLPGKRLQITTIHAKLNNIHVTIDTQYRNVTQFL